MKYLSEYRAAEPARRLAAAIRQRSRTPARIMEVCGGQTHAFLRFGVDQLLPPTLTLLHGPGCPVCVTPLEVIDQAIAISRVSHATFCTFGDMLRVPGSTTDLGAAKAQGADIRVVYSPLDAVRLAAELPEREVVFFAVGFETTAPANAMAVLEAERLGLSNFTLLVAQVLVPPALKSLLSGQDCGIDAILAAGHVCTIMGVSEYKPIAAKYRVPIVVTGFEPLDLLEGILLCVDQLENHRAEVEVQYGRAVQAAGNPSAQQALQTVFRVVERKWRGLGPIAESGLALNHDYASFDAARRFDVTQRVVAEPAECLSGLVLQGRKRPTECPAFGKRCTPETPLGATMVSSEGACAAYYRYRQTGATSVVETP